MAYQCEFLLHLQQVPLQNNKTSLEMLIIYLSHLLIQISSYLSLLFTVIGTINLNYNGERHIHNRLDSSQEMVSKLGFTLQGHPGLAHCYFSFIKLQGECDCKRDMHIAWLYDSSQGEV